MKSSAIIISLLLLTVCICACDTMDNDVPLLPPLPVAQDDNEHMFGVDKNINMETIDDYLGRDDVAYLDVRMLYDPARYEEIGGDPNLSRTIRGFRIIPYPYIATLTELPVAGAYSGPCLYDVTWGDDSRVLSVVANYKESDIILSELFPQDKSIFLMCGGGGYSSLMKSLLVFLGWDESKIYITGANWGYSGENSVELVIYPEDAREREIIATWRTDYVYIDFFRLTPA